MIFYVSTTGSATGAGTLDNPWSFAVALTGGYPANTIQPGDEVRMLGGTYGAGGNTVFLVRVAGAVGKRVKFCAVEHAHVVIDGGIRFESGYVEFWGTPGTLEILNSKWAGDKGKRYYSTGGPNLPDAVKWYPGAVECRVVNAILHDCRSGIANQGEGLGGGAYGCISYNHGWQGPGGGYAHGLYTQGHSSGQGVKAYEEIILGHNFELAGQLYGKNAVLNNHRFVGMVADGNFSASGNSTLDNVVFEKCSIRANGYMTLGGSQNTPGKVYVTDCRFSTRANMAPLYLGNFGGGSVVGCQFVNSIGAGVMWYIENGTKVYPLTVEDNGYYGVSAGGSFRIYDSAGEYVSKTFESWKSSTGYDMAGSTYKNGLPDDEVEIRPNAYEAGRGHIIIHNWSKVPNVMVDLSDLLAVGDEYEIRYVFDPFNATGKSTPVVGKWDGTPISLTLTGWDHARPIGRSDEERAAMPGDNWGAQAVTTVDFMAFLVRKTAGVVVPTTPPVEVVDANARADIAALALQVEDIKAQLAAGLTGVVVVK